MVSGRSTPLHAFGTSIGAFRHTCLAHPDPLSALDRFEEAYVAQAYEKKPTAAEVTDQSRRICETLLGSNGAAAEVLNHQHMRLHVGTVRSRGPAATDARPLLALGLAIAAATNAVSRRSLGLMFERVMFHSTDAPEFTFDDLRTRNVRLSADNLAAATLASGSIPLVMAAIHDVAGAPPGLYRDGGITDYHFAMDFDAPAGLVLYPHFFDRIVPGWFDKPLSWRKARGRLLERTVFVAPSPEFVATLPGGKVPDRDDFVTHLTVDRQRRWKEAIAACRRLGEDFEALLEGNRMAAAAQPFPG